ncbi:MAG: hypothetical protein LBC39_00185 [Methanobrevibacter sp.]|jgi:hypothetical protein|nr:hypothetical protein [Candidatus Methanovirga aequatorialis]
MISTEPKFIFIGQPLEFFALAKPTMSGISTTTKIVNRQLFFTSFYVVIVLYIVVY